MLDAWTYRLTPGSSERFLEWWAKVGVTLFSQRGIGVVGAWAAVDADEFVAIFEHHGTSEPSPISAIEPPDGTVDSISRREVRWIGPSRSRRMMDTEDASLALPRPHAWERVHVGSDDRTLYVWFVHGVPDALHHVEVVESPERVVVTVLLGTRPEFAGPGAHAYVAVGLSGCATVALEAPLDGRPILDGTSGPHTD